MKASTIFKFLVGAAFVIAGSFVRAERTSAPSPLTNHALYFIH